MEVKSLQLQLLKALEEVGELRGFGSFRKIGDPNIVP